MSQAFKRETADLAQKRLAQSLLSKILSCFVAKLTALAQVGPGRGGGAVSGPGFSVSLL